MSAHPTRREILLAGSVGLVAATGFAVLRRGPAPPVAGSPGGRAWPADPLDDDRRPLPARASDLRAGWNDLTRRAPGQQPASGVPILIGGRLTNGFDRPLPATRIEIWNANQWGRYSHMYDPSDLPDDPNFAGIGRTMTDSEGRYRFLTVKPGSYLAETGGTRHRPAHVHVAIRSGTARLVTQMYFADDPDLAGDPMFALLGDAGPRHIGQEFVPQLAAAERGFRFDIVAGGPRPTFFE